MKMIQAGLCLAMMHFCFCSAEMSPEMQRAIRLGELDKDVAKGLEQINKEQFIESLKACEKEVRAGLERKNYISPIPGSKTNIPLEVSNSLLKRFNCLKEVWITMDPSKALELCDSEFQEEQKAAVNSLKNERSVIFHGSVKMSDEEAGKFKKELLKKGEGQPNYFWIENENRKDDFLKGKITRKELLILSCHIEKDLKDKDRFAAKSVIFVWYTSRFGEKPQNHFVFYTVRWIFSGEEWGVKAADLKSIW